MSPPHLSKAVEARLRIYLDRPAAAPIVPPPPVAPDDGAAPAKQRPRPQRSARGRFFPPRRGYPSEAQRDLPARKHRDRILATIAGDGSDNNADSAPRTRTRPNNFTLLIGATGCGKSTQLPQLLLTEGTVASDPIAVVVAQPRRLAAVSLAQRVSVELGTKLGKEVGYVIRGENRTSASTVCTFVTYGVLLKMLLSGGGGGGKGVGDAEILPGVTHLLLDEVHERSADLDLVLLFLKERLGRATTGGGGGLSVTLMSATVDPVAFESYLPGLKVVEVEGRSYPVTRLYLEDAVRDTNFAVPAEERTGGRGRGRRRRSPLPDEARGLTDDEIQIAELTKALESASVSVAATLEARRDKLVAKNASSASGGLGATTERFLGALSLAETQSRFNLESPAVARSLRALDYDAVPHELIGRLVERHVEAGKNGKTAGGDVLVFLPGVGEIEALRTYLLEDFSSSRMRGNELRVLPLHANLQARDQLVAFEPPPPGATKVILATNIAEASVTIPTITLVIDAGLSRSVLLDPATSLPHLTTTLAARSSLKQRAGRAGRVRAGACYHLLLGPLSEELEAEPAPEILTMPLDSIGLRARVALEAAGGGNAAAGTTEEVLGGVMSPPPSAPCRLADAILVAAGAIADDEDDDKTEGGGKLALTRHGRLTLTRHGRILAGLPLGLAHASALAGAHRFGPAVFNDVSLVLAALNTTASRPRWAEFEAKLQKSNVSDHVALLGLVKSDARVKKEADQLRRQVAAEMGRPKTVGDSSSSSSSSGTAHLVLACLLSSSSQVGKVDGGVITYSTDVRTHLLRPHRSSVCGAAKNAKGYAYFGSIIKLPAGPVVSDVSIVSAVAAGILASHCVAPEDRSEILANFGGRMKDVFLGKENVSPEILALSDELLNDLVPPWDGLPDGWLYDNETKLFRTMNGEIHQQKKPKQSAEVALAEKESAKGSLERAERLLGSKTGKGGGNRGEGPALITVAAKSSSVVSKADLSDEAVKKATLARLQRAEEGERERVEDGGGEKGGRVARMLADLNLAEKYAGAFQAGGIDDAMIDDILLMMKGDEDDKVEGRKGIDEIIKSCGLVGGSGVKVRKYLEGGGKVGGGGGGGGGDPNRGSRKKKTTPSPVNAAKPGNVKTRSKKKKKDDLSCLESSLGGGSKGKSRGSKKR